MTSLSKPEVMIEHFARDKGLPGRAAGAPDRISSDNFLFFSKDRKKIVF
jgi:hypothetical protein